MWFTGRSQIISEQNIETNAYAEHMFACSPLCLLNIYPQREYMQIACVFYLSNVRDVSSTCRTAEQQELTTDYKRPWHFFHIALQNKH